jgi:Glutathione S-transferase, N-terminal domain
MTVLSRFAITKKWPAEHPDRIQLYSLPTPNGVKVSIMLEETGLPYEPHLVRFDTNDQLSPEFLSLNPNNKIPAIIDPNGPGGAPLALFESGAILIYLAEKSGQLMPRDAAGRYETIQWLMFQMGGIGPMFGQLGFFHKFRWQGLRRQAPARPLRGRIEAPAEGAGSAIGRPGLDHGRRVLHCRHRHVPVGQQPRGLLWRGRTGGHRRLPPRDARRAGVLGAAGGGARPGDPETGVTGRPND